MLKRTWAASSDDNIGLIAAGVAFYSFLALVPLLAATVLLYGLVADMATISAHADRLTTVLPAEMSNLVIEQLAAIVLSSAEKKGLGLLISLSIALFGARNAAGSIIIALNVAYGEREKRGFVHRNLLAIAITAAGALVGAIGAAGVGAMRLVPLALPSIPGAGLAAARIAVYLVLGAVACLAAGALYRYGPSREHARWSWLSSGALAFAIGWVLLTVLFGYYVANFGSYGATYGSLSAVVVLLTWIWLSSYALLFGAKLNAELERQTSRDTTSGPEEVMGERGAWAADTMADRVA